MASDWNVLLDRLLAADLTGEEHQLALALARLLLGWRRTSAPLGRQMLRDVSGLHGRGLERALAGLRAKGVVTVQGGGVGRGNRATYTLILTTEKAAASRPNEKAAATRPKAPVGKGRARDTEKAAHTRRRSGSGKERTPAQSADDLRRKAFETYVAAGGNLTLDRERGALARGIKTAAAAGHDPTLILDAVRDLGRHREFPGLLAQRIADFHSNGRPCDWAGLDRLRLTIPQLKECDCTRCTARAQTLETQQTVAA